MRLTIAAVVVCCVLTSVGRGFPPSRNASADHRSLGEGGHPRL